MKQKPNQQQKTLAGRPGFLTRKEFLRTTFEDCWHFDNCKGCDKTHVRTERKVEPTLDLSNPV